MINTPLTPIVKFQQLNYELSYKKHYQELSKLDLQAGKIRLWQCFMREVVNPDGND